MPSSHFPGKPAPGHTGWLAALPHHQRRLWATHRIEEHGEEELAPVDDLVQLAGATRVLIVEDGVCKEAAGLPWEDLGMGEERSRGVSRHGWWCKELSSEQAGCLPGKAASCVTAQPLKPLRVLCCQDLLQPATHAQVSPLALATSLYEMSRPKSNREG